MMRVKIFAISGSLRSISLNTRLLRFISHANLVDAEFDLFDGLGELPHYNADLDNENPPEIVANLRQRVKEADAVILSSPEYAHGVPGSFKNLLDWVVSSGEFVDKRVVLINVASTGGERVQTQILQILKVMTVTVVASASFTSAAVRKELEGEVSEDFALKLRGLLGELTNEGNHG